MNNTSSALATRTNSSIKTIIENPDIRLVLSPTDKSITNKAKDKTRAFRRYLHIIKKEFDKYDVEIRNTYSNESDIRRLYSEHIAKERTRIFKTFDKHFSYIWNYLYSDLKFREDDEKNPAYINFKSFYQREILDYFMAFGLGKQAFYKPYGYPGDFKLIENYYSDNGNNPDLFGELLHHYTISTPCGRAVRARKDYLLTQFSFINVGNILSVGAGSAPEIIEYLEANNSKNELNFSLLDINKDALDFVKNKLKRSKKLAASKLFYFQFDIIKLIRDNPVVSKQDFTYSLGLFDYFNDKLFIKYAKILYENLTQNGKLIIGNLSPAHPHRAYMALLAEWHLVYRDKESLDKLAKQSGFSNYRIEADETGIQLFLIATKTE